MIKDRREFKANKGRKDRRGFKANRETKVKKVIKVYEVSVD